MWFILVAVITSTGLDAQLVPDTAFKDQASCQEHVDWGRAKYPDDYKDGTIAVCIFKAVKAGTR